MEENLEELIKALTEKELEEITEFLDSYLESELRDLAEVTAKELEELEKLEEIINQCPITPEKTNTEKPS